MLRCKMSLALAHRLDATLYDVSCPPTWCYVVRCLLHLPTGLMLRCEMSLALAHRLDATLYDVSCTCPPTWCYAVRCLLHLPTGLMLRCEMSLALAHRLDATLYDVSCTCPPAWCYVVKSFMFRYNAGCKIWNLFRKAGQKLRLNKASPGNSNQHGQNTLQKTIRNRKMTPPPHEGHSVSSRKLAVIVAKHCKYPRNVVRAWKTKCVFREGSQVTP